jgi:hypothetical protein
MRSRLREMIYACARYTYFHDSFRITGYPETATRSQTLDTPDTIKTEKSRKPGHPSGIFI